MQFPPGSRCTPSLTGRVVPRRRSGRPVRWLCSTLILLAAATSASAQSVEDFAGAYIGRNAQGYFGPLATSLTGILNSGFSGPVPPPRGFSVRLGLLAPVALMGADQKTFNAATGEGFRPATTRAAPTIFGEERIVVEGEGGTGYVFPAGLGMDWLGVPLPQLTIGTLGTEAKLRWAAAGTTEELGDVALLGLGLRHNISQWLPPLPADVAIGGMYNSLRVGSTFDVTAMLVDVSLSRKAGWFVLYGGLGWQSSSMEVDYDSDEAESGRVALDLDGVNGLRGSAGLALTLPLAALTADVAFGSQTVLGLGLSFGLRY